MNWARLCCTLVAAVLSEPLFAKPSYDYQMIHRGLGYRSEKVPGWIENDCKHDPECEEREKYAFNYDQFSDESQEKHHIDTPTKGTAPGWSDTSPGWTENDCKNDPECEKREKYAFNYDQFSDESQETYHPDENTEESAPGWSDTSPGWAENDCKNDPECEKREKYAFNYDQFSDESQETYHPDENTEESAPGWSDTSPGWTENDCKNDPECEKREKYAFNYDQFSDESQETYHPDENTEESAPGWSDTSPGWAENDCKNDPECEKREKYAFNYDQFSDESQETYHPDENTEESAPGWSDTSPGWAENDCKNDPECEKREKYAFNYDQFSDESQETYHIDENKGNSTWMVRYISRLDRKRLQERPWMRRTRKVCLELWSVFGRFPGKALHFKHTMASITSESSEEAPTWIVKDGKNDPNCKERRKGLKLKLTPHQCFNYIIRLFSLEYNTFHL